MSRALGARPHASAYNTAHFWVEYHVMFMDLIRPVSLFLEIPSTHGIWKHLCCTADNRGFGLIMERPNRALSAHHCKQGPLRAPSLSSPSNLMLLFESWERSRRYTPLDMNPFPHPRLSSFHHLRTLRYPFMQKLEFLVSVGA